MGRTKRPSKTDVLDDSPIGNYVSPDFIATGDIHCREDQPTCRTDDFLFAQDNKLLWLKKLKEEHGGIPIFDAGDFLAKARPSAWLLRYLIRMHLKINSVPGNHDLPEHSIDNIDKSGFGVLEAAGLINNLTGRHVTINGMKVFGVPWKGVWTGKDVAEIYVMHIMTYDGEKPWPGCTDLNAKELMEIVPASIIITGHNHVPFVVQHKGKILVNPGSLFRTTAAQVDHKPRVYLCDAKNGGVKPVFVPIKPGVVSREHITSEKEKEERLSAFTSRLGDHVEISLSYEHNMEVYFSENRVRGAVKRIIEKAMP